jgi:hypothetical protein
MDEIVRQALARWPNVPDCTGWLRLDARGNWRMRDEAAQARNAPGTPIRHAALIGFINRNYERDEHGQWFFQNGPQRVYVELEYTPWVVRLSRDESGLPALTDHAGEPFGPVAAYLDERGAVLFADGAVPARIAVLHDHDLVLFAELATLADDGASGTLQWRDDVSLPLQALRRNEVPARFGFVASPAAVAAAAAPAAGDQRK